MDGRIVVTNETAAICRPLNRLLNDFFGRK